MSKEKETKYRKDYKKVPFKVESINLVFDIGDGEVTVKSTFEVKPEDDAKKMTLHGTAKLVSLKIDGEKLKEGEDYKVDGEELIVKHVPDKTFVVEVETKPDPFNNTSLMGLYESGGNLITQCEAEGFRKITHFFDRPDVLTRYTTKIIADKKKYPVMLSNGDRIDGGDLENGRHWIEWKDPFPKPSYLFCLVAGDLFESADEYVTKSGKKVAIRFYTTEKDAPKTRHAINSLKRAMLWDEERWGLEYDLNTYMVVAVGDYNMGAMENKGLNVFNTKYVLADSKSATDANFEDLEGVIGHEYFHNYTGDRVTCRDWFQLSLKEGLTVFRDQEFSSDVFNRSIKRIDDVQVMRSVQFAEDGGPTAHPVRPDKFEEINNFYTVTVYEKGAEVVRMYHTLFGERGFRKGLRHYLTKHDGEAATCDDFRNAMAETNDFDLEQFDLWYSQAGTPRVKVKSTYNEDRKELILKFKQSIPDTPGQKDKKPMLIPVRMGLVSREEREKGKGLIPFKVNLKNKENLVPSDKKVGWIKTDKDEKGDTYSIYNSSDETTDAVLLLTNEVDEFVLGGVAENPVLSLFRTWSSPVIVEHPYTDEELVTIFRNDCDKFNRWDALQTLYRRIVEENIKGESPREDSFYANIVEIVAKENDPEYISKLLQVPGVGEFMSMGEGVDPLVVHGAREKLVNSLAKAGIDLWKSYRKVCLEREKKFEDEFEAKKKSDPESAKLVFCFDAAKYRTLVNTARAMLARVDDTLVPELSRRYDELATNMTHELGILNAVNNTEGAIKEEMLEKFRSRHSDDDLVMDKYFTLIATSQAKGQAEKVKEAVFRPEFRLDNPNKVYSLFVAFTRNVPNFHAADGSGYHLIANMVKKIDRFNPQVAARLVGAFNVVSKVDERHRKLIHREVLSIKKAGNLSSDVAEKIRSILAAIGKDEKPDFSDLPPVEDTELDKRIMDIKIGKLENSESAGLAIGDESSESANKAKKSHEAKEAKALRKQKKMEKKLAKKREKEAQKAIASGHDGDENVDYDESVEELDEKTQSMESKDSNDPNNADKLAKEIGSNSAWKRAVNPVSYEDAPQPREGVPERPDDDPELSREIEISNIPNDDPDSDENYQADGKGVLETSGAEVPALGTESDSKLDKAYRKLKEMSLAMGVEFEDKKKKKGGKKKNKDKDGKKEKGKDKDKDADKKKSKDGKKSKDEKKKGKSKSSGKLLPDAHFLLDEAVKDLRKSKKKAKTKAEKEARKKAKAEKRKGSDESHGDKADEGGKVTKKFKI